MNRTTDANDSNILNHKRASNSDEVKDSTKKLRLLESLRTSNTEITCSDFGCDREILFPNYFFCHECMNWDNQNHENKRLCCDMKSYKCKVNHTSFVTPTVKVQEGCPSKSKDAYCKEISTSVRTPTKSVSNKTVQGLKKEISDLKSEKETLVFAVNRLEKELKDAKFELSEVEGDREIFRSKNKILKKHISRLETRLADKKVAKPTSLASGIVESIGCLVSKYFPRHGIKRIGEEVSKACWNFRDGIARTSMMQIARKYIR